MSNSKPTKQTYELIAETLKHLSQSYSSSSDVQTVDEVSKALAYELGKGNPKFDRGKFLSACGIETAWDKAKKPARQVRRPD